MTKKNKSDFNWFQELGLKFWDKIFSRLEREEIEEENDKILGVKRVNLTWLVITVIVLVALYLKFK